MILPGKDDRIGQRREARSSGRASASLRVFGLAAWTAIFLGCHAPEMCCNRTTLSDGVLRRTGQMLNAGTPCNEVILPPGISLDRELTEEEAVTVALWNNALFQELLVDMGLARADLITAGLLPNPELVYFFPVDHKPFKYALEVPIEAMWLRPIRIRAAERDAARTCDRLEQAALDLIRDARQAFADVLLAGERARVAQAAVELRRRISAQAEARFQAGEATPQETASARVDLLLAEQDAARAAREIPIAEERLRHVMGIGDLRDELTLDARLPPLALVLDVESLLAEATTMRPDAQAAAWAASGARERLDLARKGWIRFLGLADATSGRRKGHELGPAFRVTLPLFNRNEGAIARADAELLRAQRQQHTVHNQIVLDVRRSHAQFEQARKELEFVRDSVQPEVSRAIQRVETAFRDGDTTYLVVLQTTRQLLDTQLREAQLQADLRRAWAELERSVGRHLGQEAETQSDRDKSAAPSVPLEEGGG